MKKRIKIIIIFIIGMIITGVISAYAATVINSSEVSYTSNGQTTVLGALDDLYTLSNTWINPSYVDFTTLDTNTKQTILASKNGICIKRNNKVSCFKINNYNTEKEHIQEVFSDVSCSVETSRVHCGSSDFIFNVYQNGGMDCIDRSDNSYCQVAADGKVECAKALDIKMNSAKSIVASKAGLLFKRSNGNTYFIGTNNWSYEKDHVQQIFSDVTCSVSSGSVECISSDFNCRVLSNGGVICYDNFDDSRCYEDTDGTGYCT